MNIFIRFYASLMLREAVGKAESMHRRNGTRYYVCPNSDRRVRLIVTDRKNFRLLRHKGYIDSGYRMEEARRMCFYCTCDRSGKNGMSELERRARAIAFLEWYEKRRINPFRELLSGVKSLFRKLRLWKRRK